MKNGDLVVCIFNDNWDRFWYDFITKPIMPKKNRVYTIESDLGDGFITLLEIKNYTCFRISFPYISKTKQYDRFDKESFRLVDYNKNAISELVKEVNTYTN